METYKYKWNIIVAYDKHLGIGAANDLLWQKDLPADLKHFKDLTTGHTIVMGRKTYESIGRALPNRENIVVSSLPVEAADVVWASSIDAAYDKATSDQIFIIGGGQMYAQAYSALVNQALIDSSIIYATEVDATFENADIFFPKINPLLWVEKSREHHKADALNKYNYDFVTYVHEVDPKQLSAL